MDIKSIKNSFINGFIPNCLFYNASPEYNMSIDVNKLNIIIIINHIIFLKVNFLKVMIILLVFLM